MVKAPTPEEEDRRRLCRERKVLIGERVQHVNRVKGQLFSQGICRAEGMRPDHVRGDELVDECIGHRGHASFRESVPTPPLEARPKLD